MVAASPSFEQTKRHLQTSISSLEALIRLVALSDWTSLEANRIAPQSNQHSSRSLASSSCLCHSCIFPRYCWCYISCRGFPSVCLRCFIICRNPTPICAFSDLGLIGPDVSIARGTGPAECARLRPVLKRVYLPFLNIIFLTRWPSAPTYYPYLHITTRVANSFHARITLRDRR